ncbi:MAG: phosphoribosylglycinamide formyltransferase [Gemmatimonadota bacterium]|nr:phosphoribosylglycinamide formyltransferase [Gemmatimonadota bacterium]
MKKGLETGPPLLAAAFASGGGTNVQALLDCQDKFCPWRLSLVVTDRENAGVLERADLAGIPAAIIPVQGRAPLDVQQDMLSVLEAHRVEVIFLAGYLRLIPSEVVHRFRRRILNIHPALLPSFGGKGMYGMRVHQAVVDAGESMTGATVHYVDEEYDRGTIIGQSRVPVEPGDSPEVVAARVLKIEHRLYPLVAEHVCSALIEGRDPGPLDLPELSSTETTDLKHTE